MMQDRRMWIIMLIIFINMMGFGIILPLLPYYVESLGAGAFTTGMLLASYSLFQLLSAPILGELSDKIGRRPVLLFSIGGTALSFFVLGFANTIPLLFLARILDGASGGNISTAQAYIADITSREHRTQAMGMMSAAFSLGFIIGPATGGILSQFGYAVPAIAAGIVALIATVLTAFFLPESRDPNKSIVPGMPKKKTKIFFKLSDFTDVLKLPHVGTVTGLYFLMMFAFSLMEGTFALFTEHTLHTTATTNGFLFAYLGFLGIVIQFFLLQRILDWLTEAKANIFGIACMAGAMGLIAIGNSIPVLVVAITLMAFGWGVAGPVLTGLVSKFSPENEQGNVMGIFQSVGSLARLFGPLLGTFMYGAIAIRSPYIFATVILIASVAVAAVYVKPPKNFVEKAINSAERALGH